MSNRQDIAFLTPFANDAETTLPGVPIDGTSYRDPAFTALGPGWPYKTKVESQDFNQVMYVQTLLMRALSNQGILDYSDKEDYVAATGAAVMDDGGVYVCIQDNGPATAVKQPSAEPTFWKRIDFTSVENRIKGQQNWNIPDPSGDPLISATPTLYNVGEFPAVNVEVVNANAVNLRKDGDLIKGDSGTLRHYARNAYRAGVIDETTEYMGIKDYLGNQLEAGVTTGVTKGNNGTDLYVDVDLAQFPSGYRFAGVSAERGAWYEVSNDEARLSGPSNLERVTVLARVTFSATTGVISESYNVLGVTDNGVGDFTINFENDLPSSDYALVGCARGGAGTSVLAVQEVNTGARTPSEVNILTYFANSLNSGPADPDSVYVVIFGG